MIYNIFGRSEQYYNVPGKDRAQDKILNKIKITVTMSTEKVKDLDGKVSYKDKKPEKSF